MPLDLTALIIGDATILATGAWAWWRNRESGAARWFFIATITYANWLTINYFSLLHHESLQLLDALTRLTYAAGIWLMVAAWYFCYRFPIERKPSTRMRISSLLILIVGSLFGASTYVTEKVGYDASGDIVLTLGAGNIVYGLMLGGLAIACVVSLWRNYGQARISQRNQIRYVAFGIGSSTVLSITFNVILVPLFGPVWGSPIANLLVTLPIVLFLGYGLIRHRYVEVRRLSSILLSAITCFLLLAGIFAASDYIVHILYPDSELQQQIGLLTAVTLTVFGIQAIQARLRRFTDRLLGVGWYDSQSFLNTLGETLAGDLRLQALMENSLKQVGDILRLTAASFVRHDEKTGKFDVMQYGRWEFEVSDKTFDFTQLAQAEKLLIIEELSRKHPLYRVMRDSHIRAIVPLETQGHRVGYLLLGVKKNGDIFSTQDVTLLQIIARQLAITAISAEAFEQINRFNITLKHQVAEATADLRAANEKLRLDDRMKSEFIMLTSHNLRTPLSILSGYSSLLLEANVPDDQRKMIVGMQESIEKLTKFTEDLLAIDSLTAGNQLQLQPIEAHELLAPIVKEAEAASAQKHITFAAELAVPAEVRIQANQVRLSGALRSVLDNATKFTSEGGVTLQAFIEDGNLHIKVSDTGIGIDETELPHIFERFHRATDTLRYDYDGEGISLYLTKLVIQEHKGTISVVSTKQKGTTVTITLPLVYG